METHTDSQILHLLGCILDTRRHSRAHLWAANGVHPVVALGAVVPAVVGGEDVHDEAGRALELSVLSPADEFIVLLAK